MKYIITGNEGLIGEALNDSLKQKNECVLEVDMRNGFNVLNLGGVKLNSKTQKTDIIYHLAAHCKINEGTNNPELPHINNADGIHQVLEFARKNDIKRIVNFSSSRVLSRERNPYVASKVYGEELTKAYHDCFGLEFITVRPSTVYGPCHDITSRLMTDWVQAALNNRELVIFGDKNKTLDFTYISDFVDGVNLLTDNWEKAKNKAYNISGGEEVKLVDLANTIINEAGGGRISYSAPEIAQPQQVSVDISKIKRFGYEPKVNIAEGVKKLVRFYGREMRWQQDGC